MRPLIRILMSRGAGRGLVLALALSLAAAIGTAGTAPRAVLACSCGNECERIVHEADLIVEGRITGWERTGPDPGPGAWIPITVSMDVARVYRGAVPTPFRMTDLASLITFNVNGDHLSWGGAGGACGSFDEDPPGRYIIAALYRRPDGSFQMGRPATVFLADNPGGDYYDAVVQKLTANVGPPAAGSGHATPARSASLSPPAIAVSLVLLAASAALLAASLPRRRRP